MKLFVTGGAGFIGTNFIRYWLKEHANDELINFDALTYAGNLENLADIAGNPHYKFIKGDITNGDNVRQALTEDVDLVVHFAAESHVDRSIHDAATFVRTNVLGTQVLLDRSVEIKLKRFHHISTDEVFGSLNLDEDSKFTELTPYDPRSPYSASKAGSDHLVRAYYHTYNLPVTITNCSNNYGPYQFPEKFIPLTITNILEGKDVSVYGDGKNVRDWLHVDDHCKAVDMVVHRGRSGETYCIGGAAGEVNNLTLVKKICELMGVSDKVIKLVNDRPGHDRRYAIDWSKIKSELGWLPNHELERGLRETIDWYREHKNWWEMVKYGGK